MQFYDSSFVVMLHVPAVPHPRILAVLHNILGTNITTASTSTKITINTSTNKRIVTFILKANMIRIIIVIIINLIMHVRRREKIKEHQLLLLSLSPSRLRPLLRPMLPLSRPLPPFRPPSLLVLLPL